MSSVLAYSPDVFPSFSSSCTSFFLFFLLLVLGKRSVKKVSQCHAHGEGPCLQAESRRGFCLETLYHQESWVGEL